MRTFIPPNVLKIIAQVSLVVLLAFTALTNLASQTPTNSQAPVPRLTAEQRREFAALQEKVMRDAEYNAAVKRAIEAQKAADALFFSKMLRAAATPELQSYIKFLQQARFSQRPQAQKTD